MNKQQAQELATKIAQLQALMIAYVTGSRTTTQPYEYINLYAEVTIALERAKYANPNPHKSLEVFWASCGLFKLETYAARRAYVHDLYADIVIDLKRQELNTATPKNWTRANDALSDELAPIRLQWLKAKNFIYSPSPDFENSLKESISAVESSLMILLSEPNGTLGKLIKRANLDSDIERLVSQAYGYLSNRDFVRHGGTSASTLTKAEAEFFLEFAASCIVYITAKLRPSPATKTPRTS